MQFLTNHVKRSLLISPNNQKPQHKTKETQVHLLPNNQNSLTLSLRNVNDLFANANNSFPKHLKILINLKIIRQKIHQPFPINRKFLPPRIKIHT